MSTELTATLRHVPCSIMFHTEPTPQTHNPQPTHSQHTPKHRSTQQQTCTIIFDSSPKIFVGKFMWGRSVRVEYRYWSSAILLIHWFDRAWCGEGEEFLLEEQRAQLRFLLRNHAVFKSWQPSWIYGRTLYYFLPNKVCPLEMLVLS